MTDPTSPADGSSTVLTLDREGEERRRRNDAAIKLLDEWMADESGYDDEVWPLLKEALNRERVREGARKLFRE